MGNLQFRHWHVCPGCTQTWECYLPGGCREEKEHECRYCVDDSDEDWKEDDE